MLDTGRPKKEDLVTGRSIVDGLDSAAMAGGCRLEKVVRAGLYGAAVVVSAARGVMMVIMRLMIEKARAEERTLPKRHGWPATPPELEHDRALR